MSVLRALVGCCIGADVLFRCSAPEFFAEILLMHHLGKLVCYHSKDAIVDADTKPCDLNLLYVCSRHVHLFIVVSLAISL